MWTLALYALGITIAAVDVYHREQEYEAQKKEDGITPKYTISEAWAKATEDAWVEIAAAVVPTGGVTLVAKVYWSLVGWTTGLVFQNMADWIRQNGKVEIQTVDESENIINSTTFLLNSNGTFDVNTSITTSMGMTGTSDVNALLDSIDLNYGKITVQTDFTSPEDIAWIADNIKSVNPSLIDISAPNGHYMVGSNGADTLTGSSPTNMIIDPNTGEVLYSEGGNDTLIGGAGDDRYIINDNGGTDTIIDSDGQVFYKNYKLAEAYKQADGTYKDTRGNIFNLSGDTLTVTNPNINSQVQINNFNNGNLGIHLHESSDMPVIGEDGAKVLVNVDGRSGPWDVNVNPLYSYGGNSNFLPPTVINALSGILMIPGNTLTIKYVNGLANGGGSGIWNDAEGEVGWDGHASGAPGYYIPDEEVWLETLMGAFSDNNGVIIGSPFVIGNYRDLIVPDGATQLLLGFNDGGYADNEGSITVEVTNKSFADIFYGGAGNDSIITGDRSCNITDDGGTSTITTGAGNDKITLKSNSYSLINAGDGNNVIDIIGDPFNCYNTVITGSGNDTITIKDSYNTVNTNNGNDYINMILGNGNTIDAGAGNDTIIGSTDITATGNTMAGGMGDDVYYTGISGDVILENAEEGTDTVNSGITHTLADNLENLVLTGDSSINGTGNALNNTITGNSGDNIIAGGVGNDTITDISGNDTYIFNLGDGVDAITDSQGIDLIIFGENIVKNDIELYKTSNDLVINIKNTSDSITIKDWYTDSSRIIESLEFTDGTTLTGSEIASMDIPLLIQGTDGNNNFSGHTESNKYILGAGDDRVIDNNGNDTYIKTDGTVYIGDEAGDDVYKLNTNSSTVDDVSGNDTYNLLSGAVSINECDGNDTYIFNRGSGQCTIMEWNGIDKIKFGEGITADDLELIVNGMDINITIKNSTDSITLTEWYIEDWYGVESFEFADGTVLAKAEIVSRFTIKGTDGDDFLVGYNDSNDNFIGKAGNDQIHGNAGNDTYVFNPGDGQDRITDNSGFDKIKFGEGITADDLEFTRQFGDLFISIKNTNDLIRFINYSSTNGIEAIEFSDGSSLNYEEITSRVMIRGTNGDDSIYSYNDNNIILAGTGNDTILDQDGSDVYIFNLGDGADCITDVDTTGGNTDTVRFGEGISLADLEFSYDNRNLVIRNLTNTDQITIGGWCDNDNRKIERFEFADGTVITKDYVDSNTIILGTNGDDNIYGYGTDDIYKTRGGNDRIQDDGGNDTYIFNRGDGQDTIMDMGWNGPSNDTIRFGDGISQNDLEVTNQRGDLIIKIKDTQDQIKIQGWGWSDSNKIENFVFSDGIILDKNAIDAMVTIQQTPGDDIIWGKNTDDVYNAGAGNDIIDELAGNDTYNFNLGDGQDWINDMGGDDTIVFGSGISVSDLEITKSLGNLIIKIKNTQDQITIQGWGHSGLIPPKIETFQFSDGTTLNKTDIESMVIIPQTEGDDRIWGESSNDTYNTLGGNDWIEEQGGNDTYNTGLGNDIINDMSGDDTYIFNRGDGQDAIMDQGYLGDNDVIRFGTGITQSDLEFINRNGSLVVNIKDSDDSITINTWFNNESNRIEKFEFADSSFLTKDDISSLAVIQGTDTNDYLNGTNSNDTFNGQTGNDMMWDPAGNDTYIFNPGDGQDNINDQGGIDTVKFGTGITRADLEFTRQNDSLIVNIKNSIDMIIIENWYGMSTYQIENFQFADNSILTNDEIANLVVMQGTDGDDYINGTSSNDNIQGKAGNDTIYDPDGNDTYIFNPGDGQDTINDNNGFDVIRFGSGISKDEIVFSRVDNNLVVSNLDNLDSITVQGYYNEGSISQIERFEFADGNSILNSDIKLSIIGTNWDDMINSNSEDNQILGLAGNDTILDPAGNDIYNAGTGNDTITDQDGNDTYIFNPADGQDVISDLNGVDTISFQSGITQDKLCFSRSGNDLVANIMDSSDRITIHDWYTNDLNKIESFEFADGSSMTSDLIKLTTVGTINDDTFNIDTGDDNYIALAGNDTISDIFGNDIYNAGQGNDVITDDTGNDTYIFNLGDGQDIITDSYGNDVIKFGNGITRDDLEFSVNAGNLVTTIKNSTDQIMVNEWQWNSDKQIEFFEFSDGTTLSKDNIQFTITGTGGDDCLSGTIGNDSLNGGAGNDNLNGNEGNDTYIGGTGNDWINDMRGSDTYVFNLGDGQDMINDMGWDAPSDDTIRFGEGISISDLEITKQNGNLVIENTINSDSLTIQGWVWNDQNRIEHFEFADGSILSKDDINSMVVVKVTEGDDNVTGDVANDTYNTLGGNDRIDDMGGNDFYNAGTGNDWVNDQGGNDTYVFNPGDGQDTIMDNGWKGDSWNDVIRFGAGITSSDLSVTKQFSDLIISFNGSPDSITLQGWNNGPMIPPGGGSLLFDTNKVESFEFSNGTILSKTDIEAMVQLSITEGDDTISGSTGNDIFNALGGNDRIDDPWGNDIYTGGVGNDWFMDQGGNDIYHFNADDGQDTIMDNGWNGPSDDTVLFGNGISKENIAIYMQGSELIVDCGNGDNIRVQNQTMTQNALERFELNNGQYLTNTDINLIIQDMTAYATNNSIQLTSIEDVKNNQQLMNLVAAGWHS